MKTFGELKDNVAVLAQRSGDNDYKDKIGVWLNLSLDILANIYDYWPELQDVHNFTTVSGTGDYFLPTFFDKPFRIYDLTNKKKLTIEVEENYFDSSVSNVANATTQSSPSTARFYGISAVKRQVAAGGGTVQSKSSSATDTDSPVVRVEGFLDSDLMTHGFEDITISASTPTTAVAGTTTFYKITHVSKSKDTNGFITLEDSSGNDLAIIDNISRISRYPVVKIGLIPSQANSMRVLYKRKSRKLVDNEDYPFIDADDFLITNSWGYALSQEREGVERANVAWKKAQETLESILVNKIGKFGPDFQHKINNTFSQAHRNR